MAMSLAMPSCQGIRVIHLSEEYEDHNLKMGYGKVLVSS